MMPQDQRTSRPGTVARDGLGALRRARRVRARRGVALVMVLGALTVLTIMLAEFQTDTSTELGSSLVARDSIQAEYAAMSAINLSRLLIAAEPTIRKTLAPLFMMMKSSPPQIPVWDFADQVLGAFNDDKGGKAFQGLAGVDIAQGKNLGLGLPGVGFDVKIVDEDAKIDLNAAWHDLLSQARLAASLLGLMRPSSYDAMFDNRDADGQFSDRQTICGAIVDWVDENEERCACEPGTPMAAGAAPEDNFYQMLEPPYERKNAPFDSLEEVHLVRGIGDDFWSAFVDPDPKDPSKRAVTVWGRGKINVNTANAQTLYAVICGTSGELPKMCTDADEAAKFFSVMTLVRSMTAGAPLFPSVRSFLNTLAHKGMYGEVLKTLGLEPILLKTRREIEKVVDVQSKVFSIMAIGHSTHGKRSIVQRIHAVVDFRGAPKPDALQSPDDSASDPSAAPAGTTSTSTSAPLPEGATEDAILQALLANPAGKVIYFRVE